MKTLWSRWGAAGVAAAVTLGAWCAPAQAATGPAPSQQVLYSDTFQGGDTTPEAWLSQSKSAKSPVWPCLTAAATTVQGGIPTCAKSVTRDKAGVGAFLLTSNDKGESGFGLFTQPLQTDRGIRVDFDMYQYNAHTISDKLGKRGADGIAFFLMNGNATPASAGDAGGSLGYRNLPGALIGIGFDEFGNFSDPTWGGNGGPGTKPNNIVIRGAESTKDQYIYGVKSPQLLAVDGATARASAKRHVTIILSTNNELKVYVDFGKGPQLVIGPEDLNAIKGQPPVPATVKFGFAASTGGATAIHEITGLTVTGLDPDLTLAASHTGTFQPGGSGSYQLTVNNAADAGPTLGDTKIVFTVPAGLTPQSPTGDGWICPVSGQVVTCTRSDTLKPGGTYPVINVPVTIARNAHGAVTATGTLSDPNDSPTAGKTATDTANLGAPSPDIAVSASHSGSFTPGGTGTYTLTVSDKPAAGPTTGPVTVTYPVPAGFTPLSASGTGWTCSIASATVTCSRTDVLKPGASYPPVNVQLSVGSGTGGQTPSTVRATTTDNATSGGATATDTVTVTPLVPDLSYQITAKGPFPAGGTGRYTLTTSNAPSAGPTTGTVTQTLNVPPGQTVRSATGTGWACTVAASVVSCTRPGAGADALTGGAVYPPVTVTTDIPPSASGQVTLTGTTGTPGDTGNPGETASTTATVTPLAPDLGYTISALPVVAGDPATVTLTATDNPAAGPVTGPSAISYDIPPGYTVTSVTAPGWTCTTGASAVTCTRPDKLQPGDSFPPVTIGLKTPAKSGGDVPLTGTATTTGQSTPAAGQGQLVIQARDPKLDVSLGDTGMFTPGKAGSAYLIDVSADQAGGPVTGAVTVTFPVPSGFTPGSASGNGWSCSTSGQTVTCSRATPLDPGASYPQITVPVSAGTPVSGKIPATATASTPGSTPGSSRTITASGSDTVTVAQRAPDVGVSVTPPATLPAGGTGTYTLVTTDDPGAAPATGPTKVTFEVPGQLPVQSASGDGWSCGGSSPLITCTRDDTLQPGASFPPVQVVVAVPDNGQGTVVATSTVDTPGNSAGAYARVVTSTPVTVEPAQPATSVGCWGSEYGYDGGSGAICIHVGDPADDAPITEPVTVDVPDPAGLTPVSASGSGWNCDNQSSGYICVTEGQLHPGQQYPVINTRWAVSADVTGPVPDSATAYTPDQASTAGSTGTGTITEKPARASLSASVTGSGPVASGGTEDLTVAVSDAANAGPVTGTVTATVPLPSSLHATSVYGDGWTCSTGDSGDSVTCHIPAGGLLPGQQYPPFTVSATASAPFDGTGLTAKASS